MKFISTLFAALIVAGCVHSSPGSDVALTPIGSCKVYEGKGETSECAVELGVSRMRTGTETIVLGVQGFHPNDTSPQFEHENDLVAAWPNISASEIKAFLTRIN